MKNIRVVFFVMVAIVFSIFSTVCFAEPMVITETVVLQCGEDATFRQQEIREGGSNIQYSVRTIGIRESAEDISRDKIMQKEHIIKVELVESYGRRKMMVGDNELQTNVMAYCSGVDGRVTKNISLSCAFLQCSRNEGIRLKMSLPESTVGTKFYAVLELTTTTHNDPIEEAVEPEKPDTASELAIESEPQVVSQLELLNQRWEEVRGFLEGKGYSARAIDVFHLRVNQGRQQELNSEIESLDREIQELKAQQIVLQQTQTGGPPQPTSVNPSVNLGLNLGFSGSG